MNIYEESQRVVDQALAEAAAISSFTCGAVEIPGAIHLDWCEES